jgi:hypothetical protein
METHLDAGRLQEPAVSRSVIWNKEPCQSSYHLLVIPDGWIFCHGDYLFNTAWHLDLYLAGLVSCCQRTDRYTVCNKERHYVCGLCHAQK